MRELGILLLLSGVLAVVLPRVFYLVEWMGWAEPEGASVPARWVIRLCGAGAVMAGLLLVVLARA